MKTKHFSSDDWNDVADLMEQGACQAEDSRQTHNKNACDFVIVRLNKLAMAYQKRANEMPRKKK